MQTAETYEPVLKIPRHVAIIMDGNGRWARNRGLPRVQGHRSGVDAVKRIVRTARELGIDYLTLYSFSTENWSRPHEEVSELFNLLKIFVRKDLAELHQNNVRLRIIGDRRNIPADIEGLLSEAENLTRHNTGNTLVIAFNYGSRREIALAARKIAERVHSGELEPADIDENTVSAHLDTGGMPDPDLIIRTGGEYRLSNFLLWQANYAELIFTERKWPDFEETDLREAIAEYSRRKRRYGGLDKHYVAKEVGT